MSCAPTPTPAVRCVTEPAGAALRRDQRTRPGPEPGRGRTLCLILALLGLVLSGYLTVRSLSLIAGELPGSDLCSALFAADCDQVLAGEGSRLLGVPLASWGSVHFATIVCLLLMGWFCAEDFAAASSAAVGCLATVGLGVSGLLALQMIAGESPHCPLCWLTHLTSTGLAVAAWRHSGGFKVLAARVLAAACYAAGGSVADHVAARRTTAYLLLTVLVGGFVYQWCHVQVALRGAAAGSRDPQALIADYERIAPVTIQRDPEDPFLGDREAKARLVVFSDFQCPGCSRLARDLRELHDRFGADLSIVFKHYPLSSACNRSVRSDMHPAACQAALASTAAAAQGRFWEFHDALFDGHAAAAKGQQGEHSLSDLARRSGLDPEDFDAYRESPSAAAKVARDVAEGHRLKIEGTPTVLLNGRQLQATNRRTLEILIGHVIESGLRTASLPSGSTSTVPADS